MFCASCVCGPAAGPSGRRCDVAVEVDGQILAGQAPHNLLRRKVEDGLLCLELGEGAGDEPRERIRDQLGHVAAMISAQARARNLAISSSEAVYGSVSSRATAWAAASISAPSSAAASSASASRKKVSICR
jgi:hypothetical protein